MTAAAKFVIPALFYHVNYFGIEIQYILEINFDFLNFASDLVDLYDNDTKFVQDMMVGDDLELKK